MCKCDIDTEYNREISILNDELDRLLFQKESDMFSIGVNSNILSAIKFAIKQHKQMGFNHLGISLKELKKRKKELKKEILEKEASVLYLSEAIIMKSNSLKLKLNNPPASICGD